jgi:hypothetical protein
VGARRRLPAFIARIAAPSGGWLAMRCRKVAQGRHRGNPKSSIRHAPAPGGSPLPSGLESRHWTSAFARGLFTPATGA